MITAPFNFVPLSEKVFFPDWASDVSHDIPFSDGESGEIKIEIIAQSPIFIRDHKNTEEFCHHEHVVDGKMKKEYYIPSSSVKGMIRDVLEIMSFSKMSIYNDDTYAVRDLSRSDNFYMTEMKKKVLCGWLFEDKGSYYIENCDEPYRIHHKEIDTALGINFSSNFTKNSFEKTSEYKYKIVGGSDKKITVGKPYLSKTNAKYDKRLFCRYDELGKVGRLVLTGQPTVRRNNGKKGDGKGFEFIFMEKEKYEKLVISKKTFEKFLFAYFDGRKTEPKESPDWGFWKKKLESRNRVPIFFQKDADGNVKHLGLSYLYKLPYKHSVKDGVYDSHDSDKLDLSETIFGCINEKNSLKGRVQFSHFKVEGKAEQDVEKNEILGTPRASYYPIYVNQDSNNLFTTFMDDDFSIAGWKRYPVQCKTRTYPAPTDKYGNINKKVATTFTPLKSGVVFEGKVRYFNLKKAELGALLSAFTFHNTNECYHNIGMAKPLGYGKIKLEVKNIEVKEYLKAFELKINEQIENWHKQKQLLELLTMATEQKSICRDIEKNEGTDIWKYMSLTQFTDHKKRGQEEYLYPYSEFDKISKTIVKSLLSNDELKNLKQIQEELKEQLRLEEERREAENLLKAKEEGERVERENKERIEREKEEEKVKLFNNKLKIILDKLETEEDDLQVVKDFIEKYPNYEKIEEIKTKKDSIEKAKKDNRHKEVNEKFNRAYQALQKKKGNQNQYKKEKEKFVKKWSKEKGNKGSEYILEMIRKLK